MQTVNLNLDLTIKIPDDEQATQIHVVQELINKLYLGVEHYEDDVFSVTSLHLEKFEIV